MEDRRGQSSRGLGMVSGKGRIAVLLVVLVAGYYGVDLTGLLNDSSSYNTSEISQYSESSAEEKEAAQFTSVILASTEDCWSTIFHQMGKSYTPPKLVLYSGATIGFNVALKTVI